jgi:S-DNA-T family DNA segregation ATPase FtsK/SpoIIIE
MIDPKRLEFSYYHDIPHLLFPLINDANKAIAALQWLVKEMEQRYIILAKKTVRNISDLHVADPSTKESMPFIILLIDELADLMMVAGKEIEIELARLAQMARAAGIFLIVATQRPSVDVLTGLIKVNFPSRIAYRVTSKIDSRTILDQMGAEKLLGKGDLLLLHATKNDLQRIHGPFLSNKEIIHLADAARAYAQPNYVELPITSSRDSDANDTTDPLYEEIKDYVLNREEISISMLQRQYRIGFNRSARIIDLLESEGIIGPAIGSKPRKVL